MQIARFPNDEAARIAALQALEVLDSGPEAEFDALVHAASVVCGVSISLISLIDSERQWFKANIGLPGATETPRDLAFCAHCILDDEILEVSDATQDERFADNPLVSGHPDIRFYAGAPIRLSNGHRVGTLCVIDRQPHSLNKTQRDVLRYLAQAAASALEGRQALRKQHVLMVELHQSDARFRTLSDSSPIGVFYTDAAGSCTYTNQQWQDIYGLTLDESLGDGWVSALYPDDKATVFAAWRESAESEIDFDLNFRVFRPDGLVRHVHAMARAVLSESNAVLGYVGTVEDITERVQEHAELLSANERVALATESGQIGIWDWNLLTGELIWDELMHRLYQNDPEERDASFQLWSERLFPADAVATEAAMQEAISRTGTLDTEFRIVWPDNRVRHIRATAHVTKDDTGRPVRMVGANWDVTELRETALALANQHELLRVTLKSIGDAVITTDADSRVEWLNPIAERMTGWLSSEAKGKPLGQVFHIVNEETRKPTENPVQTCIEQGKIVGLANHTLLISRDGVEFGIEDSAAPIRDESGKILGVVLVFHDVTEQRRLSNEMSFRASHDVLTGLFNRGEFEVQLRRVLNATHEHRSQHALMFIDLDQFKLVNDACGHSAGDQLLQQVSKLFGEVVRSRDMLARLGGDEFAIILEHCTVEQAQRVAQQICDRMDDFRFLHDQQRFRIGASIGLVPIDIRWTSVEAILQAADTSCYAAKEAGRNRVHTWFDTDMAMRARHGEMQWTTRIEHALDENRFVLFAQGIHALDDSTNGIHAEVLLRMLDTDGSLVPPSAFLPAAERFHLASRIDRWVLGRVIEWMKRVRVLSMIDTLSVNLSGQSVGDRAFHRWAIGLLESAGEEVCLRLCFEITETSAVTNLADAALFIEQVRKFGARVSLDDFGAGASSFGYLKTMPVDYLKIDGQFIQDLVSDSLDEAAVRCFSDVAKVVGMKTVAEFVDHPDILAKLRLMGVDFAQGYLMHRPEPLDDLLIAAESPTLAK